MVPGLIPDGDNTAVTEKEKIVRKPLAKLTPHLTFLWIGLNIKLSRWVGAGQNY